MINYRTKGFCAKEIEFKIENDVLRNIKSHSGCHGNLTGIEGLVEGLQTRQLKTLKKGLYAPVFFYLSQKPSSFTPSPSAVLFT